MTEPAQSADLVIIGGGAAGVMTAVHALRQAGRPLRVVLVECSARLAEGIAYGTTAPEHRLNVPVRRMSAFVDQPEDFLQFMLEHHNPRNLPASVLGEAYTQRAHFAEYLRDRLRNAESAGPARLDVLSDRAVAMKREGSNWHITLASGIALQTRGAVLATGNSLRPLRVHGAGTLPPQTCLDAWQYAAIAGLPRNAEIAIIGAGLSMVDALLSLNARDHRGRIHVLSRHALLPLPHAEVHSVAAFDAASLNTLGLRQRLRRVRNWAATACARGEPWQGVMECLRPHVQTLWRSLSEDDQRRFIRHAVRQWDVHRHRVAPDVHSVVIALRERGQLELHRGRVRSVKPVGARAGVEAALGNGGTLRLEVDCIINATGVETLATSLHSPLIRDLLGNGTAKAGPHGMGIDTGDNGEVIAADGSLQPGVFALGSLRIGSLWESLAIPELRRQAETVARKLLAPDTSCSW